MTILCHKTYFWKDVFKFFGFRILQNEKQDMNKIMNACSGLLVRDLSFDSYQVGLVGSRDFYRRQFVTIV